MPEAESAGPRREIERLYRFEFEGAEELAFRYIGTFLGAVVIWLYVGWISAWVWFAVYAIVQSAYLLFLRARRDVATARDVRIAQIILVLLLVSYIWMPIRMLASPDDALSVSGFSVLGCVIIHTVRRSEKYLRMTLIEIAILSAGLVTGIAMIINRGVNLVGSIALIIAGVSLTLYLLQGAFLTRRQRLKAEELAERTRQAQKLEAIGKLAGGVAHDFNNMLTAVLGNLDLIEETDDPDLRAEFLGEARAAALHGAQVVRQLLTYARQTDGSPQPIDVASLLSSINALCKTLVPSSVGLKIQAPTEPLSLYVDETLCVAALLNLIKNGVDAVEGRGQIGVEGAERLLTANLPCASGQILPVGHYVTFSVTDTGPGIPVADLHRVTDPFFTTKAVGKGSGLGLAMVTGFALKSNAGLEIKSSPAGTTVTLLFPKLVTVPSRIIT